MSTPPKEAFTKLFKSDLTYDVLSRKRKAKKIITIVKEELGDTRKLSCLDLGSSVGYISEFLSPQFKSVVGVDVDSNAVAIAKKRVKKREVKFIVSKEKKLPFKQDSFDVIVFNQVYEHVQSPEALIKEIKRILKKNGICFFGARNKYGVFDGHYKVPFISWVPKDVANYYMRFFEGKDEYDINLYSYWRLKNLVSTFSITDYTIEIIKNPRKYSVSDVVPKNKLVHKIITLLSVSLYSLIPNYVWVLRKK